MITVIGVNNNGCFEPESIPETTLGSHFDGVNFYFFESEEEKTNFYIAINESNITE